MPAPRRRRRQSAGTIVTTLDLAKVGALLRQAGFLGCSSDPINARARYATDGSPRSVKARYLGGWCCRLTIHVNGTYSLTQSISVTLRGEPGPIA